MSDTQRLDIERPEGEPGVKEGTVVRLPLNKGQQALVISAMKEFEVVAARIEGKFSWLKYHVDFHQIGALACSEVVRTYNASMGPFPPYARKRVVGAMIKAGMKESRRRHYFRGYGEACEALVGLVDPVDSLHDSDATIRGYMESFSDQLISSVVLATLDEIKRMPGEDGIAERQLFARALLALDEEMAKLPEEDRVILKMHYWDGLWLQDIGPELGGSYSWVKRRHGEIMVKLVWALRRRGMQGARGDGLDEAGCAVLGGQGSSGQHWRGHGRGR